MKLQRYATKQTGKNGDVWGNNAAAEILNTIIGCNNWKLVGNNNIVSGSENKKSDRTQRRKQQKIQEHVIITNSSSRRKSFDGQKGSMRQCFPVFIFAVQQNRPQRDRSLARDLRGNKL